MAELGHGDSLLILGSLMAEYRYYFSRDPSTASPQTSDLESVDAESPASAVARLRSDRPPEELPTGWVHVLLWTSKDGKHRGFESSEF
jgi:hypothetical protein